MKGHDDIPEFRRTVRTSWTVYFWLIIFGIIAVCGWLIGQYVGH